MVLSRNWIKNDLFLNLFLRVQPISCFLFLRVFYPMYNLLFPMYTMYKQLDFFPLVSNDFLFIVTAFWWDFLISLEVLPKGTVLVIFQVVFHLALWSVKSHFYLRQFLLYTQKLTKVADGQILVRNVENRAYDVCSSLFKYFF